MDVLDKKIRENYMRKNVIKLTENQFYNVIKESVNKILNEITSTVHEDDFSVEMDKLYDLLKEEVGGDELSQRLFMLMGDVIFDKNDEDNYIIVYKYSKVGMVNILYDLVNYDIIAITPTEIDITNSNNVEIASIISKYVEPDMISRIYDEFQ
jgi:hypothetical protein